MSCGIDPWLLRRLACPRCRSAFVASDNSLACANGHRFPVTPDGIPVLVLGDVSQTHWAAYSSLEDAATDPPHIDGPPDSVDPIVQEAIGATGGNLYAGVIGKLKRYPIPAIPVEGPQDTVFLDIGCHWGRWCIAAARRGWRVICVDPYLTAIRAARRVANTVGADAHFLVADGRFLPFAGSTFDRVHSFSVLQHFSEEDVAACAREIGRVLAPGGSSKIQMAQRYGVLNLLHQAHRGFRRPKLFQVRYWRLQDLQATFDAAIGPTALSVDGFFSLNAQSVDIDLLGPIQRTVVRTSNRLKRAADSLPWLINVADSVYVNSTRLP
jgi:SAM-dependent methyltransferase